MATILTRKNGKGEITYFARVRRKGFKTSCATFSRKTDAQRWISELEQAVRENRYFERVEGKRHTVRQRRSSF